MKDSLVFFGSGPVAAKALSMLARDFAVEAVITKPKPAHHRGRFPVAEISEKLKLKTYTPSNKRELSDVFAKKPTTSKLGVVIDYGIIIGKDVIDYFPLGIVNSHFSLLPQWRGADPITFAVLFGQKKTGVSLMLIVEKMDEGPLLAQQPFMIPANTTTPKLTNELIKISHELLINTLPAYTAGHIRPFPQDLSLKPTYSRKLTKSDGLVDWNKPARQLEREIRAFIEWPKSTTVLAGIDVIITKASVVNISGQAGQLTPDKKQLIVYCGEAALRIEKLKPAGKNEMSNKAFLAGYGSRLLA